MTIQRITSKRVLALTASGLLAAALAACSSSTSSSPPASTGSAPATGSSSTTPATTNSNAEVVMESSPENSITQDFNPFVSTAAPQGMGATGLVYEPLVQFDLANPTVQYPWLATKYTWSNGGKSITFTIRQGVKWNDGTAVHPRRRGLHVQLRQERQQQDRHINLGGLHGHQRRRPPATR